MKLHRLFGSKTKVDILKYLLFKRQGVSMRALESELDWTFPAIKKQIDALEQCFVIAVDKQDNKRSIHISDHFSVPIKNVFVRALMHEIQEIFEGDMIEQIYRWKSFGVELDMDLVVIHNNQPKEVQEELKKKLWLVFRSYFIEIVSLTFMSASERQTRYRLADKFVLTILRNVEKAKLQ